MFKALRLRLVVTLLALTSLLFAQTALAAYACPGMSELAQPSSHTMPDCPQMAGDAQALCHAHCHGVQSALDKAEMPVPLVAAPLATLQLAYLVDFDAGSARPSVPPPLAARAGAPPLAVLHCCLRI